jgi:hypothetical protein
MFQCNPRFALGLTPNVESFADERFTDNYLGMGMGSAMKCRQADTEKDA